MPAQFKSKLRPQKRKGNVDPTRTGTLRRAMLVDVRRRFSALKARIRKLIVAEDIFGVVTNAAVIQARDELGRFAADATHKAMLGHRLMLPGVEYAWHAKHASMLAVGAFDPQEDDGHNDRAGFHHVNAYGAHRSAADALLAALSDGKYDGTREEVERAETLHSKAATAHKAAAKYASEEYGRVFNVREDFRTLSWEERQPVVNESFFAVCERDAQGRCVARGVSISADSNAQTLTKKWGLSEEQVAAVAGALPGAKIEMTGQHNRIVVHIDHPKYEAIRSVGKETIVNEWFNARQRGLGTEIFGAQVDAAVSHGYTRMECDAARGPGLNGHYTWPRLGYTGEVSGPRTEVIAGVPLPKQQSTRVELLMATPEGRAWWKENGHSFHATFDVTEGSYSRRTLDAYRAERAATGRGAAGGVGYSTPPGAIAGGPGGSGSVGNANPNHDERGRFAHADVTDLDHSWSDNMTFREVLATGGVKDGVHVVEPYVYHVKDGKAEIQTHLNSEWNGKSYSIREREMPPERIEDRTYVHGSEAALSGPQDLQPGKSYGHWGANEYDAIYLAQKGAEERSARGGSLWGQHTYEAKLSPETHIATRQQVREVVEKHPEMDQQAALIAEGYHGVAHIDIRGDVKELALFSNRLVANALHIDAAAFAADTAPSAARRAAGNYKKGHVKIHGMDVTIETPVGAQRHVKHHEHYGYIRRTIGADGDQVDCFIGQHPESRQVFVIDQLNASGAFDEHKVMLGFLNEAQARDAYSRHYPRQPGAVRAMDVGEFKQWVFTTNEREYAFHSDPEKVKAFKRWLKSHIEGYVKGEDVWAKFIEQGYKKGSGRAFDDVEKFRRIASHGDQGLEAVYAGGREAFLRSSFGAQETVQKVQLLVGRTFDELENITSDMSTRMGRVLADGLTRGEGPLSIADDLVEQVGLAQSRAETVARTEIIRAHAEGQLDAMERLGVDEVGVEVEFATADDSAVCAECASMAGDIYSIEDAHGLIPVHPRCRCAFMPKVPTFNQRAIRRHVAQRPAWYTWNRFCPTGEGGGVDPTCGVEARAASVVAKVATGDVTGAAWSLMKGQFKAEVVAQYERLPKAVQNVVEAAWSTAFIGWSASQNLAERVAKERGLSTEDAKALRGRMAINDLLLFKPLAFAAGMAGPVASAAAWLVPPATGVYLLASTAVAPLKTMKAAWGFVKDAVKDPYSAITVNTENLSDWWLALYAAAVGQGVVNPSALADRLYITANFNPHHDAAGRFASVTIEGSDADKALYHKTMSYATDTARKLILENLKEVKFVPLGKMGDEYNKLCESRVIRPGIAPPAGAYSYASQRLLSLPGETPTSEFAKDNVPNAIQTGTLQHELGHALDGGGDTARWRDRDLPQEEFVAKYGLNSPETFSETPAWIAAWRKEAGEIGTYAMMSPREGFAEFHRLVCHYKDQGKDIAGAPPRMFAFWRLHGLVD